MNDFANQVLESHNRYRQLHQAPPLIYDSDLAAAAQTWADSLAQREYLEGEDACKKEMGENVATMFCRTKQNFSGGDFSDYWYKSVVDYDFSGRNPVQPGSTALSFTQLVWKDSARLGVGRALSKAGRVYVVARYSPGGNCVGKFADNVLRTLDGKLPEFVHQAAKGDDSDASSVTSSSVPKADLKPVIGGKSPDDVLIDSTTSTRIEGFKKIVTLEEKYQCPDGKVYTREKQRVFTGALRK